MEISDGEKGKMSLRRGLSYRSQESWLLVLVHVIFQTLFLDIFPKCLRMDKSRQLLIQIRASYNKIIFCRHLNQSCNLHQAALYCTACLILPIPPISASHPFIPSSTSALSLALFLYIFFNRSVFIKPRQRAHPESFMATYNSG